METTLCPLTFAHRARWAAAMRARPAAEIVLLPRWLPVPISTERAASELSTETVAFLFQVFDYRCEISHGGILAGHGWRNIPLAFTTYSKKGAALL